MLRVLPPTFKTVYKLICWQDSFSMSGKTCNIAIQLSLQQCCKTSWMFFVASLVCRKEEDGGCTFYHNSFRT